MNEDFRDWVGRRQVIEDVIDPAPVERFSATLGDQVCRVEPGGDLPPAWHWLYFLEAAAADDLGSDGHPRRGGFLPPVSLPRRMWAAGRLVFHAPLRLGDCARRETTISAIVPKRGRNGELVFVTLEHRIFRESTLLIEEEQTIVYREPATAASPTAESDPQDAHFSRSLQPDAVLLFRYSALTFNGHRIHYDRDYAVQTEGYDGLVVQGPLTASLLLDLLRREFPQARLASFRFRGLAPLTDRRELVLCGRRSGDEVQLWAGDGQAVAMHATAMLA